MKRKLHFKYSAPLNPLDTETQTYGCRASNPGNCSSCDIDDICAFRTADQICRKPTRSWAGQYKVLKEKEIAS